jgi:hypothetical protein
MFRLAATLWDMANTRALALTLCLIFSSLGVGAAWADGFRFSGWRLGGYFMVGPRFGPSFAGPRYDGPPDRDMDGPVDERVAAPPPPGPPPARAADAPPAPQEPGGLRPDLPPAHGPRKCYSAADTRERVASAKLREPFAVMRKAAALTQAEALAGKLCRWNDQDIYEISLLRRDGMLIHVFMNAATGQVLENPKFR